MLTKDDAWARETFSSLVPFLGHRYLDRDAIDVGEAANGRNLARLRDLKTKWDPDNVFHHNVNIVRR